MKIEEVYEGKSSASKAAKLWLNISDMLVDLEDELLDLAKDERTAGVAKQAIEYLRNNEFSKLNQELKKLLG